MHRHPAIKAGSQPLVLQAGLWVTLVYWLGISPRRVGATASSVDWGLVIFQHHSGLCGDRVEGEEGEGRSTRGGLCNPPGEGGILD